MTRFQIQLLLLFLAFSSLASAQINPDTLKEWESRKYSMFIHWGLYSELGGVWKDQPVTYGLSEQIQAHAGIYSDTYEQVANRFNPGKWNADSVVLLAKNAGMKSVVMTSKHHDGFCMYHSRYTDFNVVDATPFGKDVVKELSDACKRYGLKLGLYYSNIDWHFPQAMPISHHNSDLITPEHFEYNKKQIEELLTNYGTISELWFDMGSYSFEQSLEMRQLVHRIQPDCMIGSRLGNDMGDFMIMGDNQEPDYIIGAPWQSPASFFPETWGYRSWQKRVPVEEKTREKLMSLIRVTSRGGNYLLNIGPRGDGSVVEYERDVLLNIGTWLKKYAEAIYGTQADPFHVPFEWGSITSKPGRLYLHLFSTPKNNTILLPGIQGKILDVKALTTGIICPYKMDKPGLTIEIPTTIDPQQEIAVVEVSFEGDFVAPPINLLSFDKKNTALNQSNAFEYYSNSGVDYRSRFQSVIKEAWTLNSSKNQTVNPVLFYTEEEKDRSIDLQIGNQKQTIALNQGVRTPINNDISKLTWGPVSSQGPIPMELDGLPPKGKNNVEWKKLNWKNDTIYSLPAGASQGYYLAQEITSPSEQQVLISVTSGDGIVLSLNGKIILLHNNPYKKESMKDVVLLDLKKGKNQLMIKFFNNFQKNIPAGISLQLPQQVYKQKLPAIEMEKDTNYPISWQLNHPVTPHETLNLPNLSLKFE